MLHPPMRLADRRRVMIFKKRMSCVAPGEDG